MVFVLEPRSGLGPKLGMDKHLEHRSFLVQVWGTVLEVVLGIVQERRSCLELGSSMGMQQSVRELK